MFQRREVEIDRANQPSIVPGQPRCPGTDRVQQVPGRGSGVGLGLSSCFNPLRRDSILSHLDAVSSLSSVIQSEADKSLL